MPHPPGPTPKTLQQVEALVIALLDAGEAALHHGIQPPCQIEFASVEQLPDQKWLRVTTTYECICCLLDPSHREKSVNERRSKRDKLGDLLAFLKRIDLLIPDNDGIHNIRRKSGTRFYLKLNLENKVESHKLLRARLSSASSSTSINLLPDYRSSDIDTLVHFARQQLNEFIHKEYGQVRVFGVPYPVNVLTIYTQTDVRQQINQRPHFLLNPLMSGYSSKLLSCLGVKTYEPQRYSGQQVAENFRRLVVKGKPGVGKTTYLQYLSIQCIQGSFQPDKIPIFVRLSQFERTICINQSETLLNFVSSFLIQQGLNIDFIQSILEAGRGLILLDGLDEVSLVSDEFLTDQLIQFISQFPENSFIITCRAAANKYGFAQENFKEIEIVDFDQDQVAAFIRLWFTALLGDRPEVSLKQAERLIATLNQQKHRAIRDLARIPLMLNLICLVFWKAEALPALCSNLYEQGINILLEDWDRYRHINRDVNPYNLKKVHILELMQRIARETFEQSCFLFEQRKLEWLVSDYLKSLELPQESPVQLQENCKSLIKAIETNYGLLVEQTSGIFSFSHLGFHEYFTACSICLKQLWKELLGHLTDPQWREIFLLVADMSPSADDLIRMMLEQIQLSFADEIELQRFLSWVNKMAVRVTQTLPYDPTAVRAWYLFSAGCNLGEGINSFRVSDESLWDFQAFTLAETLGLDDDFAKDLHELYFLFHTLFIALSSVASDELAANLLAALKASYSQRSLNIVLPVLHSIRPLLLQLRNFTYPDQQQKFMSWWYHSGHAWATEAIDILKASKCDGDDDEGGWATNSDILVQENTLTSYYEANLLIINFMERAGSLTLTLKEEIKATLLLPYNSH